MNWGKLIDTVENTELEKNVIMCLIKIHQNLPIPQFQFPINFISDAGDAKLVNVKLILEQIPKSTSMHISPDHLIMT